MNSTLLSKKAIAVWVAVAAIVGTGSFAIAVGPATHQEMPPDIQHTSDVKIHLQDVDGKVVTNVPVAASRAFSPLPVQFDDDEGPTVTSGTAGSGIGTTQKMILNFVLDVSEDVEVDLKLNNKSEDTQIFLIKASAPSNVIIDMETGTGTKPVTVHGLTGHNEWLASIPGGATGDEGNLAIEVSTTDAGFYPIVVQLLRVG